MSTLKLRIPFRKFARKSETQSARWSFRKEKCRLPLVTVTSSHGAATLMTSVGGRGVPPPEEAQLKTDTVCGGERTWSNNNQLERPTLRGLMFDAHFRSRGPWWNWRDQPCEASCSTHGHVRFSFSQTLAGTAHCQDSKLNKQSADLGKQRMHESVMRRAFYDAKQAQTKKSKFW